jgi:hypothetical protein
MTASVIISAATVTYISRAASSSFVFIIIIISPTATTRSSTIALFFMVTITINLLFSTSTLVIEMHPQILWEITQDERVQLQPSKIFAPGGAV